LEKLISYVAEFAQEFCGSAGVQCRLALPTHDTDCHVPAAVRHHVCMVLKESLNNAIRHSHAGEICVTITYSAPVFSMEIRDNGSGFDKTRMATDGQSWHHCGLGDMQHRAAEIGGTVVVTSQPGSGTTVRLTVNIERVRHGHPPAGR
jgi:signal transduction histidine kinase